MSNLLEASNITDRRPVILSAANRPRILFVDDEERILRALQSMFRLEYDVSTTTDSRLVGDMLKREHFHVIVSDQRMPEMQGVEVLRTAREVSPNTVRLLLTGFADLAAIIGSVNEGEIFRYVSKPWDNEELSEHIASAANTGIALAAAASAKQQHAPAAQESPVADYGEPLNVLYVDRDGRLMHEFRADSVPGLQTHWAATSSDALDIMQRQVISIVVAAVDGKDRENVDFLNVLNVKHPHIVSLVVASVGDSTMLINLINVVRVFRVVFRPVRPTISKLYLTSARKQAMQFHTAPILLRTQQPHRASRSATLLNGFGQRLLSIKTLFGRA